MSLSPRHQDRIRIPHQPAPPQHWPVECAEQMGPTEIRVFVCPDPSCKDRPPHRVHRDDMLEQDTLTCYGDGVLHERLDA